MRETPASSYNDAAYHRQVMYRLLSLWTALSRRRLSVVCLGARLSAAASVLASWAPRAPPQRSANAAARHLPPLPDASPRGNATLEPLQRQDVESALS